MPSQDYSQQVHAAFTSLRKGLRPFVEQEMKAVYGNKWIEACQEVRGIKFNRDGLPELDNYALLNVMRVYWEKVFEMDQRRGPKARGAVSELIDWRHKLEGHLARDVPKQDALDFVETVSFMLKCVDAKDESGNINDLLQSLLPQSIESELPLVTKSSPQSGILPKASEAQSSSETVNVVEVGLPKKVETSDFWDADNFDFADALNEEIWLLSPDVQQQVQSPSMLEQTGAIGSQQAMLDSNLLAERGPLPWVPDLVGKHSQSQTGVVIVGSAYAGFISEYSTRAATLPLIKYLAASSVQDFQRMFLSYVVRPDPSYYIPLENLCSSFGSASQLSLIDLCRVSLVKRGLQFGKRSDSSKKVFEEAPATFEKYVESDQAADWLWRRFADGQAKCVIALGSTAEHGLLRLFSRHGLTVTQGNSPFLLKRFAPGAWAMRYADSTRNLRFWLDHETWWTVRGQVDGTERVWHILPVYHPSARPPNSDPGYERTKVVLNSMQAAAKS